MSNVFPAVIGVSLMAFTAALALLCHRIHIRGYHAGAKAVYAEIRLYQKDMRGHIPLPAMEALNEAACFAAHHERNYMAMPSGLSVRSQYGWLGGWQPSATSPAGGRRRK